MSPSSRLQQVLIYDLDDSSNSQRRLCNTRTSKSLRPSLSVFKTRLSGSPATKVTHGIASFQTRRSWHSIITLSRPIVPTSSPTLASFTTQQTRAARGTLSLHLPHQTDLAHKCYSSILTARTGSSGRATRLARVAVGLNATLKRTFHVTTGGSGRWLRNTYGTALGPATGDSWWIPLRSYANHSATRKAPNASSRWRLTRCGS